MLYGFDKYTEEEIAKWRKIIYGIPHMSTGGTVSMSTHLANWKWEGHTICGMVSANKTLTRDLPKLTCDTCILRLLREGQKHGLDAKDIERWDLDALEKHK
jgi:hypothetical protein